MSQKIDIRERRYNGADYDTLHPETNINMILDSSNNSVGGVNGALYGDGNGNIVGASISNPNLLDNPWFTVNQRGATSGTIVNGAYTVDRWAVHYGTTSGATWAISANGFTINVGASSLAYIDQGIENGTNYDGKIMTISALFADSTIISWTFTRATGTQQNKDIGNIRLLWSSSEQIGIAAMSGSFTLRAVKLELGSISTLANDVAPNYELELQKCRGHVLVVGGDSTTVLIGWMGDTTLMRGSTLTDLNFTPTTISMTGSFYVYAGGSFAGVSSVALQNSNKHNIDVTTSAALQNNAVAIMRGVDSTSKIIISDGLG